MHWCFEGKITREELMADRRFKVKKKPAPNRPYIALLLLLLVLLVGSVFMFYPPADKITQGLDVQGGLSIVYRAEKSDGTAVTAEDMAAAQQIVERRVNLLGASEASVQVQGDNQLLVQIPGAVDSTEALNVLGTAGVLEFVDVSKLPTDVQTTINNGSYYPRNYLAQSGLLTQMGTVPVNAELFVTKSSTTDEDAEAPIDPFSLLPASTVSNPFQTDWLGQSVRLPVASTGGLDLEPLRLESGSYNEAVIFTGANITNVTVGQEGDLSAYWAVNITLDSTGGAAFGTTTTELYPTTGKVAIVLDGYVQSAPAVQGPIPNGEVAITGDYTNKEASALRTILQSGSLPVTLDEELSQIVGPTLGQEALRAGILVAIIGLIIVAIYLLIFYKGVGLLTAGAIGVFALIYLGVLATLSFFGLFSLSLAGIAGIVLAIGVAADSSILVLERFKEEIRMGRSVRAASITGVKHAITTSIDADLVALVSALALFFIAVGAVKGFGLTLALGVVCDIITMLIFKAPLIRLLAPGSIAKNPGFWGIKEDLDTASAAGEVRREVVHG
jgi:SecD/SecF fusion protein